MATEGLSSRPTQVAYVGLGSNLGDPQHQVRQALAALDLLPGTRLLAASALYVTAPVGPQDQPDYVNAAARLETRLPPLDLLAALLAVEAAQGRHRNGTRWGPRILDLDLSNQTHIVQCRRKYLSLNG